MINSMEGGGAERVFSKLTNLLVENDNVDFEIVIIDNFPHKYKLPNQIKIHQLSNGKHRLLALFKFIILARKIKPKNIVSFLTAANFYNVIASLFCGHRAIISERSNTVGRLGNGKFSNVKRLVTKLVYQSADKIVAVSEGVKVGLIKDLGLKQDNIIVISNPVDMISLDFMSTQSPHNQQNYLVAMGRLTKTKGFNDLLHAYAKSKHRNGLKILGKGPEQAKLIQLADELGISNDVEFCGYLANPYPIIKNAAAFVLCSHLEGFPNALIESMALGKAVISTNCLDGPNEIFDCWDKPSEGDLIETRYGLLVNVSDPQGMAKAMDKIYDDNLLRQRLQCEAKHKVADYRNEIFVGKFVSMIN